MSVNELVAALKATPIKAHCRFIEALETNYYNFYSATTALRWSIPTARKVQAQLQQHAIRLGVRSGDLQ